MSNENIIQYCKEQYIESRINPQFAILIKGKWGCGKTFLVKKILNETFPNTYDKNVVWISLYGLSNLSQLNTKIYQTLHPILTGKIAKFTTQVVRSALKLSTNIDLNSDGNNDLALNITIPDLEIDENNIKTKKIFIIDDMERCNIPPNEILGFFSDFIVEYNMKVIFIGNIEKIHNKSDKQKFEGIKEKIIGIELEVEAEISSALESFFKDFKSEKIFDVKEVFEKKCLEVLQNLNYKNLRTVRQSFFYINEILKKLGTDRNNEEYLEKFIEYFLIVFIQKAKGVLKKEKVTEAIDLYCSEKKTLEEFWKDNKENFRDQPFYHQHIPLGSLLGDIIFDGLMDDRICQDYDEFIAKKDINSNLQYLYMNWTTMKDGEFKESFENVKKEFNQNHFKFSSEILEYANLMFLLSHSKIIKDTFDEIKENIFLYINSNKDNIVQKKSVFDEPFTMHTNLPFDKQILEILNKLNENLRNKQIKGMVASLDNISAYELVIKLMDLSRLYNISIFENIESIPVFYKALREETYDTQTKVLGLLNQAYGALYDNTVLNKVFYLDIEKIKELKELYEKDSEQKIMSPESLQCKNFAKKYKGLYDWMVESKEGNLQADTSEIEAENAVVEGE